jgi:oxygen-dependent protoporphyrinogen oxidase
MKSSPVAVVILAFEAHALPGKRSAAPEGFGVLIPRGEDFRSLGILYPASLFIGRAPQGMAVTTTFLGGALDPKALDQSDDALFDLAEEEVRRIHPKLGIRMQAWVTRWPSAIPRIPVGHHETLRLLAEDLAALDGNNDSFLVTGAWRDGVSLAERISRGTEYGARL